MFQGHFRYIEHFRCLYSSVYEINYNNWTINCPIPPVLWCWPRRVSGS